VRRLGWALAALGGLLVLVAGATYLAGEQTEVVVLRTLDETGTAHATKMWVVDLDGTPWVRVANPRRGWYRRLLANPRVELVRGGAARPMLARPDHSSQARRRVDAAFAARYGRVDAWYGLLLRRDPVPIRLEPVPGAAGPTGGP
jgi:Uncharacterized protein conserved in bacteria (DUF2255)